MIEVVHTTTTVLFDEPVWKHLVTLVGSISEGAIIEVVFITFVGAQTLLSVNLVLRKCKVFAQFEVLREPISGSNFAIFDVLFARIRGFAS